MQQTFELRFREPQDASPKLVRTAFRYQAPAGKTPLVHRFALETQELEEKGAKRFRWIKTIPGLTVCFLRSR